MSVYKVSLPVFEGPFDLLYHLIEEQKLSIYDIPIAKITAQYLDYLHVMEILDMEVASGFLVMAATLLEIKSKLLLPKEKNIDLEEGDDFLDEDRTEEDARAELVEKLLEYKKFKLVAQELREKERNLSRIYTRADQIDRAPLDILEINIGPIELLNFFQGLIKRRTNPPIHRVVFEKLSMAERILEIKNMLSQFKKSITFDQIIKNKKSRYEIVLSFMAILEMNKAGEILVNQSDNFKTIRVRASASPASEQ